MGRVNAAVAANLPIEAVEVGVKKDGTIADVYMIANRYGMFADYDGIGHTAEITDG